MSEHHQENKPASYSTGNIYNLSSDDLDKSRNKNIELFQSMYKTNSTHIERIISTGQFTPSDEWYDQEKDEYVILLKGEATLLMENKLENDQVELKEVTLKNGDYINIPKHVRHKVKETSKDEPCIWLAVHYC